MPVINPDSRAFQGLATFLAFVGLNVVYLVACIPVITIGAATSALLEVTMRYSDDERGYPFKDFFPAFVRNFPRATVLAVVLLGPAAALAFGAVFWWSYEGTAAAAAMGLSVLGCCFFLVTFGVAMALVARYRNGVRQTLRNALLLPLAEPVRAWGAFLIPVTSVALAVIFPPFTFLLATIGVSFGAYLAAFLYRSMFSRQTDPVT